MKTPQCFVPDVSWEMDVSFGTTRTGVEKPHLWTWGADWGKYWARCRHCDVSFRFIPKKGDRINQETLDDFWVSQFEKVSKR